MFGGLPATGAIARTATNIRSGAASPFAGMIHAVTLLVILLAAAPLAGYIPLAVGPQRCDGLDSHRAPRQSQAPEKAAGERVKPRSACRS